MICVLGCLKFAGLVSPLIKQGEVCINLELEGEELRWDIENGVRK